MEPSYDIYDLYAVTSAYRLFYLTPLMISVIINILTKQKYEIIRVTQALLFLIFCDKFFNLFAFKMKGYTVFPQVVCFVLVLVCFIIPLRMIMATKNKLRFILKTVLIYALQILIILGISKLIVFDVAHGSSMEPNEHNRCISIKGYKINSITDIKRGDTISYEKVIKKATNYRKKQKNGKRVIGLPGDRISYIDNQVIINGKVITTTKLNKQYCYHNENEYACGDLYLETLPNKVSYKILRLTKTQYKLYSRNMEEITVPENHIFVLGDNRLVSADSRSNGTVPIENVKNKTKEAFFC